MKLLMKLVEVNSFEVLLGIERELGLRVKVKLPDDRMKIDGSVSGFEERLVNE